MQPYGYQYSPINQPNSMNQMYQNFNPSFGYSQNNPFYNNNTNTQNTQGINEVIQGSIVDSIDVVRSKNCSLDGSATYYPLSDKSAIYCKQLNPQTGAGMLLTYKLETPTEQTGPTIEEQITTILSGFKEDISKEITELKGLIENKSKYIPPLQPIPQSPQINQNKRNRGEE